MQLFQTYQEDVEKERRSDLAKIEALKKEVHRLHQFWEELAQIREERDKVLDEVKTQTKKIASLENQKNKLE